MTRPRKHEPRQHQLNVRFSTRELIRIHHHASLTGKSVTDFGRSVMLRRPRRRRRREPRLICLPDRLLQRWHTLGNAINHFAHDLNARDQLDPRALAILLRRLRLLLRRCFCEHFEDDATIAPYAFAPAARTQLRKACTNLVQIADRCRLLGLAPPPSLSGLIRRLRALLNGDQAAHGA